MNVVRCKNGCFFDGDKYIKCPHCGEGTSADNTKQEKEKKSIWGKHTSPSEQTQGGSGVRKDPSLMNVFDPNTESQSQDKKGKSTSQSKRGETFGFWGNSVTPEPETVPINVPIFKPDEPVKASSDDFTGAPIAEKKPIENNYMTIPPVEEETPEDSVVENVAPASEERSGGQSLQEAIKKASANSAGKTMSYFSAATSDAQSASTAPQISVDPVVGWLVCIGGKHFGQSFVIASGKNSIGRNDDNKIVLSMDNTVSRSKHAFITYEPKKRNFYLQPGDSSGLTYLNEEFIDESKLLHAKDVIELGESKFCFVPLCGETFTWEDYITKE